MIKNYNRIYFLGIGGIGMSSLAFYFINENKYVAGYDKVNSDITKSLSKNGAKIHFTDNYLSIPSQFLNQSETLVVYTPAISKFNKEYKYFKDNGFEILKRSELLGLISKDKFCIAIGGTHGKTTTSTILSHILLENNISFTSFIGGISENYNTNFIQNGNDIILVEADEFDRSFHTLFPNIACVTSTDSDHLDIYNSEQELKKSFIQFTDNIKSKGLLFSNEKTLLGGISYGFSSESEYFISNYSSAKYSSFFDINHNGSLIASVKFNMPGKHNALNALAAFAIGKELNIDYKSIINSLSTFLGVKRRFSYALRLPKIIIDDYAHHPSEIKAVYDTIKDLYPNKKNTAIFQPHLYTRTRDFMSEFAEILSKFDNIILTEIYPAREKPINNISSIKLLELIKNKNKSILKKSELSKSLKESKSEVFVIMGAGDIADEVELIKNNILN
ncbi:MAG: UDP-N-acetylmuramate--L-alanine ligase [Flavobacteriaceae bacterium]|jgi:UDP-N-acetylmuramate--alanine ligase|nr:UDP-N-acetylmuramate--L-alanine ligase [Flavobacteriaceae bacterium]